MYHLPVGAEPSIMRERFREFLDLLSGRSLWLKRNGRTVKQTFFLGGSCSGVWLIHPSSSLYRANLFPKKHTSSSISSCLPSSSLEYSRTGLLASSLPLLTHRERFWACIYPNITNFWMKLYSEGFFIDFWWSNTSKSALNRSSRGNFWPPRGELRVDFRLEKSLRIYFPAKFSTYWPKIEQPLAIFTNLWGKSILRDFSSLHDVRKLRFY